MKKPNPLPLPKTRKVRWPWEGGKSGMPRVRGSGQAHREQQIESTGYHGSVKLKALMKAKGL